ncbi:MAG: hypothetical protein RIT25_261 [Planctomycetota bacterium]
MLLAALATPENATATPYGAWLSVVVVGALALLVVGGALSIVRLVTRVLDRIQGTETRLSTYECGEEPVGSAWFRFNNRFTTVALTFLVFDVELALMLPILPRCLEWDRPGQRLGRVPRGAGVRRRPGNRACLGGAHGRLPVGPCRGARTLGRCT